MMGYRRETPRRVAVGFTVLLSCLAILGVATALAATPPAVHWAIRSFAQPTEFSSADVDDQYTLLVENVGGQQASAPIVVEDTLPAGVTTATAKPFAREPWECEEVGVGAQTVRCTLPSNFPALSQNEGQGVYHGGAIGIPVTVTPGTEGPLINSATVTGGEVTTTATVSTEVGSSVLPFGPLNLTSTPLDPAGESYTQAGGHPNSLVTTFNVPSANSDEGSNNPGVQGPAATEYIKQVVIDLPPGFIGDAEATPKCTLTQLQQSSNTETLEPVCPAASKIGTLTLIQPPNGNGARAVSGLLIYNLVPEKGHAAEFGVYEPGFQHAQLLYGSLVGSGATAHVEVTSAPLTEFVEITGFSTIFYGNPSAKDHSPQNPVAFLTNPSYCGAANETTTAHVDSWQNPGRLNPNGSPDLSDPNWHAATTTNAPVTGCNLPTFSPTLSLGPESSHSSADEPSGYEATLTVPQNEDPNGLATPPLRNAVVTLPPGIVVSPSAADGLVGCPPSGSEGIELESNEAGHCPSSSVVGTVEVVTPLLADPLRGNVYVASPTCGGPGQSACTEEAVEAGEVFGLYVEAAGSGVTVKLKGRVEVGGVGAHSRTTGLSSGQVRTVFTDAPQQPFSVLRLKFNGGPQAPLANPQQCGSFSAVSSLTPWSASGEASTLPSVPFAITGCSPRFTPRFVAGSVSPQAGGPTTFETLISRKDREEDLSGLIIHLPNGLLGSVAGITRCSEAAANAGACPPDSRIGSVTAQIGSGTQPYTQSGTVYLTDAYHGAPFGIAVVVPAVAGPYNLGLVVVRGMISVDPQTAALTVSSDPFPQSVDGVPLRLKAVTVKIDRARFMRNPTSCAPAQVTAQINSVAGAVSGGASRFQAAGCAGLPFAPVFTATTLSKTSRPNGATFSVKLRQREGEAAIHAVDVQLPVDLPSRLTTLQKACTAQQFALNPAGCPSDSLVGTATATTPLLNVALSGPAYLVSHGGAEFPDLVLVLQGEGITLDLVGHTQIKKGITYSHFDTVPDAPVREFTLTLPQGPKSLLAGFGNLCRERLVMPTTLTGQNGAVVSANKRIEVTGCPNTLIVASRALAKKSVTLSVVVPAAGTLTASARGFKATKAHTGGRETVKLILRRPTSRKARIRVTLAFSSASGHRLTHRLSLVAP